MVDKGARSGNNVAPLTNNLLAIKANRQYSAYKKTIIPANISSTAFFIAFAVCVWLRSAHIVWTNDSERSVVISPPKRESCTGVRTPCQLCMCANVICALGTLIGSRREKITTKSEDAC